MPSVSKSTDLFLSAPSVCFQYGNAEYVASTHDKFNVGNAIVWNQENVEPLFGKIEFLCKKLHSSLAQNPTENADMAVVLFSQPTCQLPGHITNPPKNRNLVPVNQVVLRHSGRLTLDATTQIISLIGNCIATRQGFNKAELEDFGKDECVLVQTNDKLLSGKILITGHVTNPLINSKVLCVGVKFESSLNGCKPNITISHQNPNQVCKECAGGTLAFIPLTLLTFYEYKDHATFPVAENPCTSLLQSRAKPISMTKKIKPDMPELHLFVGNCVALEQEIQKLKISGLPTGANVQAKSKRVSIDGVIKITCTINGFDGDTFVGIEFKSPLDSIGDSIDIKHTGLNGQTGRTCEKCKGGKLVFVSEKCFTSHFVKTRADLVFQVLLGFK